MGELNERQDNTSAEQEDTSTKEPETFTEEQVKERERKAKSDALADIGRYKKAAEDAIKAAQAAGERVNRMLREQEEAELEAARDEPGKISEIRARQTLRQKATDLEERERKLRESEDKHAEALKAVVESTKEQNAREIATRLNVEAKTLIKLAKLTDGSLEAIEDIAKDLPQRGDKPPLKPDSGGTIGGGRGIPTNMEQFKKWIASISQSEYEKLKPQIDEMRASGKIK